MSTSGRTRRSLLAGALLIGAAAVFTAAAPHATAVDPPPYSGEGVLRLHLSGTAGTVTLENEDGVVATQHITSNRCKVSSSGARLLTFSPSTADVGVVSSGLGVRTKNNCNTDSGRIAVGQSLTVTLGPDFSNTVEITEARMDIEGKFGAQLQVALDGEHFDTFSLSTSSDNGPDSGPGDNTRVTIGPEQEAGPFQSITLSPSVGAVSLEGGGDYSSSVGPNDTFFSVDSEFADDLSCLETRPAALFGGSALDASITRLDNENNCEDIGINFEILDEGVLLEKTGEGLETGALQPVRAQVTIYWTPFTPTTPDADWREINFTPDDVDAWVDVQWCLGQDENGLWEHPADTPWCLISDYSVLNEDGDIEQVQVYDGAGDPMWR
jgi:hypothetical protein